MNSSPLRSGVAVKKRRSYSVEDEFEVKRFAVALREEDSDISWTSMMKEIRKKFDVGPSVAQRMINRSPESPERRSKGRPRLMTAKGVQAWDKALKIMSAKRLHVGLVDIQEIVCLT